MTYSLDLRARIVAMYDEGHTYDEVAAVFSVHPRTVRNYIKRRDETGSFEPLPHGGHPPIKLSDDDRAVLKRLHEEDNDAYLRELAERLFEACGKRVGIETIRRELKAMDITRKKNTSKQPSKKVPKSRN